MPPPDPAAALTPPSTAPKPRAAELAASVTAAIASSRLAAQASALKLQDQLDELLQKAVSREELAQQLGSTALKMQEHIRAQDAQLAATLGGREEERLPLGRKVDHIAKQLGGLQLLAQQQLLATNESIERSRALEEKHAATEAAIGQLRTAVAAVGRDVASQRQELQAATALVAKLAASRWSAAEGEATAAPSSAPRSRVGPAATRR